MYSSYGASWSARGDHSPLTTPRHPLRDFYIAELAARAQAFVIARVFALALRLCFETILVSADALLSSLPALCISSLLGLSVSSLPALCSLCSCLWSLLCTSLSFALLVLLCLSSRRRLYCVRLCFCIRLYSAFARRSRLLHLYNN